LAGFKVTERIQADPQTVFAYLTDVENATKVLSTVKKTEKLSAKALDVGTRYLQVRQIAGREQSAEYEVLELSAPNRYAVSRVQDGIRATYTYSLQPIGGSTLIELDCEVSGDGFNKVLAWLVAIAMQRDDATLLTKFRHAFESDLGI
jgi:carbon monoxide dehydrogenase subunit G